MRLRFKWDTLLMASVVAVAGVCAQSQQFAQAQEQKEPEGRIVQIGEAKGEDEAAVEAPAAPAFWIGLRGRGIEDPVLRTQLQLAEDMGVVVEDVVAESPAEKAGLRKHDIILRANDEVVDSMEVLQKQVVSTGDKPIDLKVIRLAKEIDVTVTPETRPENFQALMGPEAGAMAEDLLGGDLGRLLGQLQGGAGLPGGMRVFGPGMVLHGRQFNVDAVPNGISVSIARSGEGPAQITVKKGDQTWTLNSDDAKALAELPEDVRNYVSGMINGENGGGAQLGNFDWQAELRHQLPDRLGNLPGLDKAFKAEEDEVTRRLNEMQQQLKQLQEKLNEAEKEAAR